MQLLPHNKTHEESRVKSWIPRRLVQSHVDKEAPRSAMTNPALPA